MWKKYRKIGIQEMRPYIPGEDLSKVSVSSKDIPGLGGMIAKGADDEALWYVSKHFFKDNYRIAGVCNCEGMQFVEHIKKHLDDGQNVICKICGKTVSEIANIEYIERI